MNTNEKWEMRKWEERYEEKIRERPELGTIRSCSTAGQVLGKKWRINIRLDVHHQIDPMDFSPSCFSYYFKISTDPQNSNCTEIYHNTDLFNRNMCITNFPSFWQLQLAFSKVNLCFPFPFKTIPPTKEYTLKKLSNSFEFSNELFNEDLFSLQYPLTVAAFVLRSKHFAHKKAAHSSC